MSDILQVGILLISHSRVLLRCQESSLPDFPNTVSHRFPNTADNPNADLNISELSVQI